MKKYVIAAGVPRAGKSTLCRMLAGELGYQHISMDAVLAGIETVFPETGIDTEADLPPLEKFRQISAKAAPFLRAMMDSGEYDECGYGAVFDICQLMPEDCVRFFDPERCEIVYLLTSDVSPEERFAILKAHDTPLDYTYENTDGENRQECAELVEMSLALRAECETCGVAFYETARNRPEILRQIVSRIADA